MVSEAWKLLDHAYNIRQKIKSLEKAKSRVEVLYNNGLIGFQEYRDTISSISTELSRLEIEYYETLGRIRSIIDEVKASINFIKGVYEEIKKPPVRLNISKEEVSRIERKVQVIRQSVDLLSRETTHRKKENEGSIHPKLQSREVIETNHREKESLIHRIRKIFSIGKSYKREVPERKYHQEKRGLGEAAVEFYKTLQRARRRESFRKISLPSKSTRKILLRRRTNPYNVDLRDFFVRWSNKVFGRLSEELLLRFPKLYAVIYDLLRSAGIKMLVRTYISVFLMIITLSFLVAIVLIVLSIILGIRISIPLLLVILLISFVVLLFLFYYYPIYEKKEKARKINAMLPFAIIHMAALARAGISYNQIFKIMAETKEYGALADEFAKIVEYSDQLGVGLSKAIRDVAQESPSEEFREFLQDLVLSMESGTSVREYLEIAAESAIIHYKTSGQKFVQALKTISDIYVGLVVTTPLILVTMIILLTSFVDSLFGMSIERIVQLIVYIGVPVINLGVLTFVGKINQQ